MKKTLIVLGVVASLASCNNKPKQTTKPAIVTTAIPKKDFSQIKFSNTIDPVCGMKLKFGIGDSTLYKGKPIAFCSDGCKSEFLKNPSGYAVK